MNDDDNIIPFWDEEYMENRQEALQQDDEYVDDSNYGIPSELEDQ